MKLDAIVIGAGPIGIEMAAALKKEGLSFAHIERGRIGETIFHYPPATHFFSSPERIAIAGVPLLTQDQTKATREEYLLYLRSVVTQLDLETRLYESVESVTQAADSFQVQTRHTLTEQKTTYTARNVILATGDMHKPRMLGIPGESLPHVSHYPADPHSYFRTRVLIVGGKNSAAETALRLTRAGARVTISYRHAKLPEASIKYWILPDLLGLIRTGEIDFIAESHLLEIEPGKVKLKTASGNLEKDFEMVLLLTGFEIDPTLYHRCGIKTDPKTNRPHWNEATMESNVPGIYLAGTGVAGTQSPYRFFIENCHEHVEIILSRLTGKKTRVFKKFFEMPES
ncbi:MAG TPA: NAD(P)-binding domain-containing protein [Leptospiraceae bacterium]|nr:NAD(P)-binding domain-containing protein [Leptospiraceae bacterium]